MINSNLKTLIERYLTQNYIDPFAMAQDDIVCCSCKPLCLAPLEVSKLKTLILNLNDGFSIALQKLIDLKGISDVECYKKAGVSKQTWFKIINEKNYKPSKNTVIAFSIALELSYEETQALLSTVGFTLSKSSKFDVIIEYFIKHKIYDVFLINEALYAFDLTCLTV